MKTSIFKTVETPLNSDFNLQLGESGVTFRYNNASKLPGISTLPLGYQMIAKQFFKKEIPTDSETDYAINYIEDELMLHPELKGGKQSLLTTDDMLKAIFVKNKLTADTFSRQRVEDLFTDYARVAMGTPASFMDVEVTREDFAALLVLREIMHHLDFEQIKFE